MIQIVFTYKTKFCANWKICKLMYCHRNPQEMRDMSVYLG